MALTLDDKWAIQDLVNRFCHYSDYGEWDKLRALYTDTATTELVGLNTRFRGPDEQVLHAQHSFEHARGKNRHYNHNLIIDETSDDDEAWARYYIQQLAAQDAPGATGLGVTARMEDRVVRTAAGWRIAERRFHCDQTFQLSAEELAQYQ